MFVVQFKVLFSCHGEQKSLKYSSSFYYRSLWMNFSPSELQSYLIKSIPSNKPHLISSEYRKIILTLTHLNVFWPSSDVDYSVPIRNYHKQLKHDITCDLKPPFWINCSLCKFVPHICDAQLTFCAFVGNKNNPVLCSCGCIPKCVFTSPANVRSPSTMTITSLSLAVNAGLFTFG